jgi:K+-sensing histidine kinase KdpD
MAKTPEQWLQQISPDKPRGPGNRKTYSMRSEATRRAKRCEDVVVGVVEGQGRKATAELARKLERVSPRKLEILSIADGLAQLVHETHITQLVVGRTARLGWQRYLYLSAVQRFLCDSASVDVHIITQEGH